MTEYTSFEHAHCKVTILYDECAENPRSDRDYAGTMVCFHSRYTLGDKNGLSTCRADIEMALPQCSFENMDWDNPAELYETAENAGFILLPLYLYDHSGLTMNTTGFSCPWDSGQVGFIYITRERAIREWGQKICTTKVRAAAIRCMDAEVEEYDNYLTGNVFGFTVEHASGQEDSCWGFYGDPEYCIGEAKESADYLEQEARRSKQARIKTMIRNHVPLDIRARKLTA